MKAQADQHAANVLPIIKEAQRPGANTLRAVAEALNARGIATARGGSWHAMSVKNMLDRVALVAGAANIIGLAVTLMLTGTISVMLECTVARSSSAGPWSQATWPKRLAGAPGRARCNHRRWVEPTYDKPVLLPEQRGASLVMNNIIYIVGLVVVVGAVLAFFGLR